MPITIGSNISSLMAQRRLADGTSQLSRTFERLSSGQRINKAADDAAGLAITESLKADRRVLNQGVRNFNDGLSLLNIADGAIESLTNIVTRLKELAEQSANGTYSLIQRKAIDKEAQALSKEYARIAQSTKFNGLNLFNGTTGEVSLQGGYGNDGSLQSGLGGAIGDGTFKSGVSYLPAITVRSEHAGDFNGDGISDLLIGDQTNRRFRVAIGNGDGTFSTHASYSIGGVAGNYTATLGDFNNDGILDFAGASTAGVMGVFIGNGDGSFAAQATYATSVQTHKLSSGDFNGDGIDDIAAVSYTGITLFTSSGNGTFSQGDVQDPNLTTVNNLVSGDFNGDGIDDIAMSALDYAVQYGEHVKILLGNSSGIFTEGESYFITGTFAGPDVATGDFNGDGIADLVSADYYNQSVSVLIGKGDGTFGGLNTYNLSIGNIFTVTTGDFNGDGVTDIAASGYNYGDENFAVLLGAGNGEFELRTQHIVANVIISLTAADFNGDGVSDLVARGSAPTDNLILIGQSTNGISALMPFSLKSVADARQALPVFDNKIQQLAKQRGQIGAFQSRVQVGINNLQSASENYAAAESRIRDADVAQESSQLLRLNILQRAASSVLSQANLQPELALALLSI